MEAPTESELRERYEQMTSQELRRFLMPMERDGMTDRALSVIESILAERGEPAETLADPRCLACAAPLDLESGVLLSKTTWIGLLLAGFGYQPTWFLPDDTGRKRIVLRPRLSRRASRCRNCGMILFPGGL